MSLICFLVELLPLLPFYINEGLAVRMHYVGKKSYLKVLIVFKIFYAFWAENQYQLSRISL